MTNVLLSRRPGATGRSEVEPRFGETVDVVVAGLGTAGAMAALVAAEEGLRVLAVEKLDLPGGTSTAGGVAGYYYGLPGGAYEMIDREAETRRQADFVSGGSFHADAKAAVLMDRLEAAGVTALMETAVVGVFLAAAGPGGENGRTRVVGVRCATPDGVKEYGCRFLVDGTGDALVAAMAGAVTVEGRAGDGQCQPASSIRVFRRDEGLGMANFDAGYARSSSAEELNRLVFHSNALHAAPPSAPQELLYWITQLPGLREGRLIRGEETLTFAGFMDNAPPAGTPLLYAYSNYDSHSRDWAFTERRYRDWMVAASLWGKAFCVPVTLGMMIPQGVDNLLAVGRALSVDHLTASLVRMQRCLQKMGEAAARAIALATRGGVGLRDIDQAELAASLRPNGCLDEAIHPDCSFLGEDGALRDALASEAPGEAIWVLSRTPGSPVLAAALAGDDAMARRHAALALGIAGDPRALPELRAVVRERDAFMPKSSRAQNQGRLAAAIDLLGRFPEPENVDTLLAFWREGPSDVQHQTHLVRALVELGDRLPGERRRIREGLDGVLSRPGFSAKLLLKNSSATRDCVYEELAAALRTMAGEAAERWDGERHDPGIGTVPCHHGVDGRGSGTAASVG